MRTLTLDRPSLANLLELIESQPGDYRHLFRGQGNAHWGLVPALYRTQPNIGSESIESSFGFYEQAAIERFFDEGLPYLPPIARNFTNDRILAQHFGVPTRLLDWTMDPLVATYFAVEDWQSAADAALFMILPDARFTPTRPQDLTGPHQVVAMRPPAIDRRIPAQKSMFTMHPYGLSDRPFVPLDQRPDMGNWITTTGNASVRGFAKVIIPARFKRGLYQTLLGLGIDRRNLFPGLDGVGTDIAARTRSGQIW